MGYEPSVALAPWPIADPALLVEDETECVVQINGKIRKRLQVSPSISEADLRELAMSQENVISEIAGREPKVVIVRPPKIVNIVLG